MFLFCKENNDYIRTHKISDLFLFHSILYKSIPYDLITEAIFFRVMVKKKILIEFFSCLSWTVIWKFVEPLKRRKKRMKEFWNLFHCIEKADPVQLKEMF